MATEANPPAALSNIRAVLIELGITEDDLTTETYTDAVMRPRLSRWAACHHCSFGLKE